MWRAWAAMVKDSANGFPLASNHNNDGYNRLQSVCLLNYETQGTNPFSLDTNGGVQRLGRGIWILPFLPFCYSTASESGKRMKASIYGPNKPVSLPLRHSTFHWLQLRSKWCFILPIFFFGENCVLSRLQLPWLRCVANKKGLPSKPQCASTWATWFGDLGDAVWGAHRPTCIGMERSAKGLMIVLPSSLTPSLWPSRWVGGSSLSVGRIVSFLCGDKAHVSGQIPQPAPPVVLMKCYFISF